MNWKSFIVAVQVLIVCGNLNAAELPAFPGAEGWGSTTKGGRGGRVIEVTNLDDHGPGSLRAAVDATGPRTVVFRVSGTITLDRDLEIHEPFITIAGQTAPGDGICLRRYKLGVATHDAVVRYLRVRRGDESREPDDGIGVYDAANVVVDHCTISWTCDEALNTWHHTTNVTVQWCLVSEALHDSVIRKGHGFAASIGGIRNSIHHNLLANNPGRNPSIAGNKEYPTIDLDFRNNVVFNWENRTADGKPESINLVNNYYKPGPMTKDSVRIARVDHRGTLPVGRWFIDGNLLEGKPEILSDNWKFGVKVDYPNPLVARAEKPNPFAPVQTVSAADVFAEVLLHVGATMPKRDPIDARIVEEVRTGRTTFGNGVVHAPKDVGGWPELKSTPPPVDSDHDGIPDEWEIKHGLNPNDPGDAVKDANGDGYTNLEKYLNGTDPRKFVDYRKPENNQNVFHRATPAPSVKP